MNNLKIRFLNCDVMTVKNNDGEIYFKGKDIAKILGYKNTKQAIIANVDNDDKCKLDDFGLPVNNQVKNTVMINKNGLKALICRSRMSKSADLARKLGINVYNNKYECKESESIGAIMKAFEGEKMRTQYPVKGYKVDLYFPDYNLCIECDENNHDDRDEDDEITRQKRITKHLKCQWLRFDPDSKDFNIFKVINQIFMIIKSKI